MSFNCWHKISDPGTGTIASKTSGWTADSFSAGLEVDFSDVVPMGAVAVECSIRRGGTAHWIYVRAKDDPNIANTPGASTEGACYVIGPDDAIARIIIPLSADRKAEITVGNTGVDVYVDYPSWWIG